VVRHHRENGDGAQPLDVRPKVTAATATGAPASCRPRLGHEPCRPMRGRGTAQRSLKAKRFSKTPEPGGLRRMTDAHDTPTLDDVLQTTEQAIPDRREHGNASVRPDGDALDAHMEEERAAVGIEDPTPDDAPPRGERPLGHRHRSMAPTRLTLSRPRPTRTLKGGPQRRLPQHIARRSGPPTPAPSAGPERSSRPFRTIR
jgi:hypothetical protein